MRVRHPAEKIVDKSIGEGDVHRVSGDEHTVVDRADELVDLGWDGWKDLCLPVLKLLEPRIAPGTLVVADDVDLSDLQPYLDYVRDPDNGYESVTFPVEDGMEISCRL